MLQETKIASSIDAQREELIGLDIRFEREALSQVPIADAFATIITGIRRCGKSTLLLQLLSKHYPDALYINFDDIRLAGFETDDFVRLHHQITERGIDVLFFDEVQQIAGWEKYVNQLLRERYRVFITGSNASMLSAELGTHLTGRHLSMELFPFSYTEFIAFKGLADSPESARRYMTSGGIPEYVKTGIGPILGTLIDDILIRDIAVRHGVRDVASLRQLAAYLITNISHLVSASRLVGMFGIKSASTFLEYFSYLRDSYLCDFVSQFSHSLKVQARNPKKVYVMDMGLYTEATLAPSQNLGARLENQVFLHLRRFSKNICYFKGKGECDFVVMHKGQPTHLVQACALLSDENFEREYNGLIEAMQATGLTEGTIVTLEGRDRFEKNGMRVEIIPLNEFFVSTY